MSTNVEPQIPKGVLLLQVRSADLTEDQMQALEQWMADAGMPTDGPLAADRDYTTYYGPTDRPPLPDDGDMSLPPGVTGVELARVLVRDLSERQQMKVLKALVKAFGEEGLSIMGSRKWMVLHRQDPPG